MEIRAYTWPVPARFLCSPPACAFYPSYMHVIFPSLPSKFQHSCFDFIDLPEMEDSFFKKHWEGFTGFWSERFSFLDNYTRFKNLPSWSTSDVEEFIASDPVHGPVVSISSIYVSSIYYNFCNFVFTCYCYIVLLLVSIEILHFVRPFSLPS